MSQIPSINPLDTALRGEVPSGFGALKTEDFIRIIFTELAHQDPFSPNDSAALLEQLNSIRSIESDIDLMERLESLVFENQLAAAANLIGKLVDGLTPQLERVSGIVVSVVRQGDTVSLELENGQRVPIDSVQTIHEVESH
ncbi:MAG: flagellar hook capping FlgD N-terminal domain-containing protein [Planctomycetota bacterium]|jgi:flagellar basal-body rod modification protein FlgD